MKKVQLVFLIGGICLGLIVLAGFFPVSTPDQPAKTIPVREQYTAGLKTFTRSIDDYQQAAKAFDGSTSSLERLQEAHLECRGAFKKIEYLLAYFDHEATKNFINGAPLPSLMPKVPEIAILEPEGLQVLDELVFADHPIAEREAIVGFVDLLQQNMDRISLYQMQVAVYPRHVFEAARQELIRIATLGLTGFDTPGSLNAIPEAYRALSGVEAGISSFYPLMSEMDRTETEALFAKAKTYLQQHTDFDSFDRLAYLKDHLNPLFAHLYRVHRTLGIETIDEVSTYPQPTNYEATNLFADEFLNPSYFTKTNDQDITSERIALGKLLFFDPILSATNERSCASCHQPDKGFTDGLPKSLALNYDGFIQRNSPTVLNAIYSNRWFYDMRLERFDMQIQHVIFNEKEFDTNFREVLNKIKQSEEYIRLFQEAYSNTGEYAIGPWSLQNAITSYVSSLTSFNAPFDQYVRGESEELSDAAKRGFNLFMGKAACGTCHFAPTFNGTVPPLFSDSESEVLGVPATPDTLNPVLDTDKGRKMNGRPQDKAPFFEYSFKTTTVRNIALTAPYMHNGVYETLEEVIDFYNRGGGLGMGIDVPHQTLPADPLNLTDQEISDLVVFMQSLTDTIGMTDIPTTLPTFADHPEWNNRPIGGSY